MNSLQFAIVDYAIFIISLTASICIGIYFAFYHNKKKSESEYLYGNKEMKAIPVGLSIFSSALSAVTIIGMPIETYYYGTQNAIGVFGSMIALLVIWTFVLPVFCGNLNIKTPYEYYDLRYNKNVKLLASFIFIIYSLLVMPAILYAPSVILNQATGIPIIICAVLITGVCLFYTTVGGFKAVIWTDSLQAIIMLVSYLFVAIAGFYKIGGWHEISTKGYKGGRIEFFNMNPSPLERTTFWTTIIGHIFMNCSHIGCGVGTLQRYMSLQNEKQAKISTSIGCLGTILTTSTGAFIGLIIYAKYISCDPVLNKDIASPNQILSYFISDTIDYIPGFNGLFIAGLLSAALSTLSSVLNVKSGIIYYDFVLNFCKTNFAKNNGILTMKLIAFANGIVYLLCVPLIQNSKHILELMLSIAGITYGATFGMICLGILVPKSNAKGVIAGALTSVVVMIWINVGAQRNNINSFYRKETSIENCTNLNNTYNLNISNSTADKSELENIFILYRISYLYYSLFGTIITITVAIIVSYLTKSKEAKKLDPLLIAPFLRAYVQKQNSLN